jgi:DNA polymerase-3 subunit gamma/tau
MPPGHIVGHLENILGQEGVNFEQPALRLLAQGAHGSMRDALSLTDQAIAYAAGEVTLDAVQGMLGALDQSYLVRLLDALAKQDGADLMAVADEMASRSLSYNGALQDLATLLHRVALAQSVPSAVPEDLPELADIQRLAGQFDPQEVQLYYQIAVHGRNEIGLAPDEYAGFTMTLLRMLAFRPGQGGAEAPAPAPVAAARPAAPPARPAAAAAAVASHSAVAPPPRPAPPAAPAPAAQAAPSGGGAPAISPARAAINAALEAARAASRSPGSGGRAAPPRAEPPAAPAPAAPTPSAPPAPSAQLAPAAPSAPAPAPARAAPTGTPPWDGGQPKAVARPQPQAVRSGYDAQAEGDEPPSWVTEFSDDTAVAAEAPAAVAPPPTARAPARAPHPYVVTPVPEIGWDGNWPALAATLPLRGVSQQLALQTELIECVPAPSAVTFRLRVPVDTLRVSGNSEKLTAALQDCFPAVRVNLETEIGPVWYTASAEARAHREQMQREAEATVDADPWVQQMAGTFDAFVVPGSVRPIAT